MAKFSRHNSRASKLTAEQVVEIRNKYWKENWTQARLARFYGVTEGTVGRIVRGTSWQAFGGPGTHAGAAEQTELQAEIELAAQNAALHNDGPPSAEAQAALARIMAMDLTPYSGHEETKDGKHDADLEGVAGAGSASAQGPAGAGGEAHRPPAGAGGDGAGAGDRSGESGLAAGAEGDNSHEAGT